MTAYTEFDVLPPLSYDLIMADPPWSFSNWSAKGVHKNASAKYDCMSLDAIKRMRVSQLATPDAVLWLWATNPLLPQAFEVMRAWGFTFKTAGAWAKMTARGKQHFGTGYVLRSAHEPFLIGVIGKPKFAKNVRSLFMAPTGVHSQKPDEAFTIAELLAPNANRRLELFSRKSRPGWDAFGDEVGNLDEVAS